MTKGTGLRCLRGKRYETSFLYPSAVRLVCLHAGLQVTAPTPLKVLFYDLETAPLLAHIWHPSDDYVPMDRLVHGSFLLCWSAKWADGKKVMSGVLTGPEARDQDDGRIVAELAELVREADFLVAHNANKFDIPMFNNRLLILGLEPMGPKRSIDTLVLAKQAFRLPYNKLDYLGVALGLGRKLKTDFDLWLACYQGDAKALAQMVKYNRQDVVLLEAVYGKLLPYVKNLPRLVEPTSLGQFACPTCGSENLTRRGVHRTNASTFQRFQCVCGRYCRQKTSDKVRLSVAPL